MRYPEWLAILTLMNNPAPKRGEIWTANLGDPKQHWVLIISLDVPNLSNRVSSVLIVPFGSYGAEGPTVIKLEPGETGLPSASYLKAHFITTLQKSSLIRRMPRSLSGSRMREIVNLVKQAIDPEAYL